MIRTSAFAVLTVALLGGTAVLAAPASAPPAQLSDTAQNDNGARSAQDNYGRDSDDAAPSAGRQADAINRDQASRDMFCRRDAAARTGYTTPDDARRDEQARGSIGGALGGAALGAIIGGAGHGNAGTGAAIGAGAGLLAGTVVGAENGRRAARDVQRDYADAYYACMDEADDRTPSRGARYDDRYGYGPPSGYYGYGYPSYYPGYYYGPGYFGPPAISFGFGFGGYRGFHGNGGYHGGFGGHRR